MKIEEQSISAERAQGRQDVLKVFREEYSRIDRSNSVALNSALSWFYHELLTAVEERFAVRIPYNEDITKQFFGDNELWPCDELDAVLKTMSKDLLPKFNAIRKDLPPREFQQVLYRIFALKDKVLETSQCLSEIRGVIYTHLMKKR